MGFLGLIFILAVVAAVGYVAATGLQNVPAGQVGLVQRHFGLRRPDDDPRVSIYGAAGPQAQVLRANTLYWRPRYLYKIKYVPQTYVPNGTIGVVVAKAGAVRALLRHQHIPVPSDHR